MSIDKRADPLDLVSHWRRLGGNYKRWFMANTGSAACYREQETRLMDLLRGLSFTSVFELGCGFGRMTKLICDEFHPARYSAIDVSSDQLEHARAAAPGVTYHELPIQRFAPLDERWDVVIATEVLMHIAPEDIAGVIGKLACMSVGHVVNIDRANVGALGPSEARGRDMFLHPYETLYAGFGRLKVIPLTAMPSQPFALYHLDRTP